jgi:hypothetical protein
VPVAGDAQDLAGEEVHPPGLRALSAFTDRHVEEPVLAELEVTGVVEPGR